MNKYSRIFLGLLISMCCMWFVFRGFDFQGFKHILSDVSWPYVLGSFLVYVIGHLIRSLRWHFLLSPIKKTAVLKLFPILMLGFLTNNVLPARAGELARGLALKKHTGIELPTALSSIAIDRLFDVAAFLLLVFFGISYLPIHWLSREKILMLLGICVLICLTAFFINKKYSYENKNVFMSRLKKFLMQIVMGVKSLASPKIVFIASFLSLGVVVIEVLNIFILSRALHLPLNVNQSAALLLAIVFGVAIPASPGSMGTFEFFSKQLLVSMNFSSTTALSFLLFIHAYYLLINCGLGLLYFIPSNSKKEININLETSSS